MCIKEQFWFCLVFIAHLFLTSSPWYLSEILKSSLLDHDFRKAPNRLPAHMTCCLMDMLLGIPKPLVGSWNLKSSIPVQIIPPVTAHMISSRPRSLGSSCFPVSYIFLKLVGNQNLFNHCTHNCKYHVSPLCLGPQLFKIGISSEEHPRKFLYQEQYLKTFCF